MLINWKRFIINLLPVKLRTATVYAFINAALTPVVNLYNAFLVYFTEVDYKLKHTSQVFSLRAVLNDAFDVDQRRITVDDPGGAEIILLDLDSYENAVILDTDEYAAVIIHVDSDYNGTDFDFVVNVPFLFPTSEKYRLRALVDYYKLAGKRYDVIYQSSAPDDDLNDFTF